MKILRLGLIIVTGFLFGMLLNKSRSFVNTSTLFKAKTEAQKNIETYWSETGLSLSDVEKIISNEHCYSSQRYFQACVNAVAKNAASYDLKLTDESSNTIETVSSGRLEELSEKEFLKIYLTGSRKINFNKAVKDLFGAEEAAKKSFLAAKIINSYLSVYQDPHTYLLPTNFYEEVGSKIARSKLFVGISYQKKNGSFYINKVSKNSDAEISGLQLYDKILFINKIDVKNSDYKTISAVLSDEQLPTIDFLVERNHKKIQISVKRRFRELSHVQYNDIELNKKYGLISLSKFSPGVCAEVANILKASRVKKISGLILDLRDNPGGQIDEAACIAGLFIGKNKKACYVEYFDKDKPNEVILTSENKIYDGPLVVLVNSLSASSSELLAGGLKDYKRALVVGERTFGKGTFQEPEPWLQNSSVSLFKTQGFYLLPSQNSTQLVGVTPDIVLNFEVNSRYEDTVYFNPIHFVRNNTHKLRNSELMNEYSYNLCDKSNTAQKVSDLYVDRAVGYLECVQRSDINLAMSENSAHQTQ